MSAISRLALLTLADVVGVEIHSSARSERSKNRNVGVTAPGTQEWITDEHAKLSTTSSSLPGQTLSSRVVSLTLPAYGGPISLTTCGDEGSEASTTRTPGLGWG